MRAQNDVGLDGNIPVYFVGNAAYETGLLPHFHAAVEIYRHHIAHPSTMLSEIRAYANSIERYKQTMITYEEEKAKFYTPHEKRIANILERMDKIPNLVQDLSVFYAAEISWLRSPVELGSIDNEIKKLWATHQRSTNLPQKFRDEILECCRFRKDVDPASTYNHPLLGLAGIDQHFHFQEVERVKQMQALRVH